MFFEALLSFLVNPTGTVDFNTTTAFDDFSGDEKRLGSRPKHFMLWKNVFKLDTYPIQSVVKVDDTIT